MCLLRVFFITLSFSNFIFHSSLCKQEQQESRLALLRVTPAWEGQAWCFGRWFKTRIKQEPDVQGHRGDLSVVTSDQVHLPWEPSPALHFGLLTRSFAGCRGPALLHFLPLLSHRMYLSRQFL